MKTIDEFVDEKIDDEWADISPEYCKHLIREYATMVLEAVVAVIDDPYIKIDDYIK